MKKSTEEEAGDAPSAESEETKNESSKAELEAELKVERERAEDYLRRLQYLQAEFDNYRKRIEREREESSRAAADRLLVSLLSVYDELKLAIEVAETADDNKVIVAGLKMVSKKLEGLFASEGVRPIEAVGKEFDPNLHEIVEREDLGGAKGLIVEEIRKGFTLRGKVIRSSLVRVGVAPTEKSGESKGV